ncbi:uncharacterized protein DMENIID0001_014530 [Sergentomyia squamirostris]
MEEKIHHILKINEFPPRIIRRLTQSRTVEQGMREETPKEDPKVFRSIAYIPGMSERMGKIVRQMTPDVQVCFRPINQVRRVFTKLKDPIPMELRSRVVYEIPCKDCNKVYIGTTNQHLKTRIRQHERDCKPPIKNENSTALCKHSVKSHHKFGFSDTKIIATHNNYHKRMLMEAMLIKKNIARCVNKRSDIDGVSAIYASLIGDGRRNWKETNDGNQTNATPILFETTGGNGG